MRATSIRVLVSITALLLVTFSQAEAQWCALPNWSAGAVCPVDVYGPGVATDGTFVYAAGGHSLGVSAALTAVNRYDPATDSWTALAPLPTGTAYAPLVYNPSDNKLYSFGGFDGSVALEITYVYDIATNVWTAGPLLPGPRVQMGGGILNERIYLVGGYDSNSVTPQAQNWEFDPAAGTYTDRAVLPAPLAGPAYVVADGLLYIIGGRDVANYALDTVYAYDPVGNSWSTLASLPLAVNGAAAVRIPGPGTDPCAGDIVVAGGGDPFEGGPNNHAGAEGTRAIAQTQIFDIVTNTWTTGTNLTAARSFVSATNVDDLLIVIGGWNGSTSVNSVDIVTAPVPVGLQSITVE